MAQRILPRVTYQPPQEGGKEKKNPRQLGVSGREGYAPGDMPIDQLFPWIGEQIGNIGEGFNASNRNPMFAGNYLTGGAGAGGDVGAGVLPAPYASAPTVPNAGIGARNAYAGVPNASTVPWNPLTEQAPFGPANASKVTYNPSLFGTQFSSGAAGTPNTAINNRNAYMENAGAGAGQPPTNTPPPTAPTGGQMAGPGNDQTVAAWQAWMDKNKGLTEQAKAAGDEKEMARLDAEWARVTSTPGFQKFYGSQDPFAVKQRLINSYMQPDNEAAESSFDRAAGRMLADDIWAQQATMAFGRAPNELEWKEHWLAMNKGGRDPLEGNPQAVQNIQAAQREMERLNQQAAFDMMQQWMNNAKV